MGTLVPPQRSGRGLTLMPAKCRQAPSEVKICSKGSVYSIKLQRRREYRGATHAQRRSRRPCRAPRSRPFKSTITTNLFEAAVNSRTQTTRPGYQTVPPAVLADLQRKKVQVGELIAFNAVVKTTSEKQCYLQLDGGKSEYL